jgi:ArsR family transcriptional regulator
MSIDPCAWPTGGVFVFPHMRSSLPSSELLVALAEPTRLRILNCLAGGPLFVSDLQALLEVPQPTVSRHLRVLRELQVVSDTQVAQFVLYRLSRRLGSSERLLKAILEAVHQEERFKAERHRARDRSRSHPRVRTAIMQSTN